MSSIPIAYSATPLAGSASYTGPWVRVPVPDDGDADAASPVVYHDKQFVRGESYADQAGTIAIQQSPDGVTVRHTDSHACAAATSETFLATVFYRFVRILYTNGVVAQTAFALAARLQEET